MTYKVTVLEGDGIGPEITRQAVRALKTAANLCGFSVETENALIGGAAIDACGSPLPDDTLNLCKVSDAVLLGAVGGPKWDSLSGDKRPEKGLLAIRGGLELFANLRPAVVYPALRGASPLKDEILGDGLDLLIVRELTGGIYFGDRGCGQKNGRINADGAVNGYKFAFDTEAYNEVEIRRICEVAFNLAQKRGKRLCSVDKANVLESSRLWRETAIKLAEKYPDVELSHMYVDNAAMQLVRAPRQFDVIVTSNMFGDILSDEASQITGSIGMLPSASLGEGRLGLYEPVHGSAPDIAGKNIANPIATILSAAMMLRYSLERPDAAEIIENAVSNVLDSGARTADIAYAGEKPVGTVEMCDNIIKAMRI